MADRITRWNIYEQPIAAQMDYRRARRAEAVEMTARNAALANGFASISSNRVAEEGNLFSRIAMERIAGQRVSKSA